MKCLGCNTENETLVESFCRSCVPQHIRALRKHLDNERKKTAKLIKFVQIIAFDDTPDIAVDLIREVKGDREVLK